MQSVMNGVMNVHMYLVSWYIYKSIKTESWSVKCPTSDRRVPGIRIKIDIFTVISVVSCSVVYADHIFITY